MKPAVIGSERLENERTAGFLIYEISAIRSWCKLYEREVGFYVDLTLRVTKSHAWQECSVEIIEG